MSLGGAIKLIILCLCGGEGVCLGGGAKQTFRLVGWGEVSRVNEPITVVLAREGGRERESVCVCLCVSECWVASVDYIQ